MKATLVYVTLFFVLVYQGRAQPATSQNHTTEDILGTSLVLSAEKLVHEEDTLGTSLLATQYEEVLGSSMLCEDESQNAEIECNDYLGKSLIYSPNQSAFETPVHSLKDFTEDGWLSELKDSIRGPCYTSTPLKSRRELQFDRVMAKQKPVKKLTSYLCKEVQGAKKLKHKALDHEHIQSSLKQTCRCGQMCMKKMHFLKLKHLRLSYWSQSVLVRRQLLKLYVKRSYLKGKHRYINVDSDCDVCSRAFLCVLRINKNALSNAIKACEKELENTPGRCPRKVKENTLLTINWLEDYASFYGDKMPNSEDVMLPYKFRKLSVYKSYLADSSVNDQVSKTQFFKIWKNYFPHLKIKQTNSFSKCATCTILEKHRENAVDYETKARYGQLKDEHHERQHMERRYYYSKRDASKKAPLKSMSIIIDGMDQAKTNLPHFTGRISKDVNPSDLLKTRVTGVINHGVGGFHTYVDINEYAHDPNLTINVLLKALKKAADRNGNTLPAILYVQADNCGRENKNRYVLAFLELLVAENIFHEVHLSFLYVGHTHEDIDAAFSKISQTIKGCDIETLPELINVLPEPEEIGQVYNVKEWMEPYLAEMSKISFPLHYKFEKENNTVRMYYKGPHYLSWVSVEEKILSGKPQGKPKQVKPDYSKINVDKNIKQIHRLQPLFKNPHSVQFWEEFYSSIKLSTRNVKETKWLLDELPRQRDESIEMENLEVPDRIKKIIDKETTVPKVIVKRKKKQVKTKVSEKTKESNDAKETGQKKYKDLPDTPTYFDYLKDSLTSTQVTVVWTKGYGGGLRQTFVLNISQRSQPIKYDYINETENENMQHTITGLSSGTQYKLTLWATNMLGKSLSQTLTIFTKESEAKETSSLAAAIAGSVSSLVAIIAGVSVACLLYKRRYLKKTDRSIGERSFDDGSEMNAQSGRNNPVKREPVYEGLKAINERGYVEMKEQTYDILKYKQDSSETNDPVYTNLKL